MIKKTLLTIALILITFFFTSCQTIEGLGKDIEYIGQTEITWETE